MNNFIVLHMLALALLSGCAIGPLVVHETARTVGHSNSELIAGYGQAGYLLKANFGVSDNLDLGIHMESMSIGVRGKYAFINNKEGFAFAAAAGVGTSGGGDHYYGDLLTSYHAGAFEPYGVVRYVHVKTDPIEFGDRNNPSSWNFTVDSYKFNYGQLTLGSRFWFSENWLLSLEASTLFAVSDGVHFANAVIVGGAFGYRFQ